MLARLRHKLPRLFFSLLYLRRPRWDRGISPSELLAFIENHPPGRALDLGSGSGTNVITLAQHGWQATGIDFVSKAIRRARRKAKRAGVEVTFIRGDVTNADLLDGQYDMILDIGCYHSLSQEQRQQYQQNLTHHLAPHGTYLLYSFWATDDNLARISQSDLDAFETFLTLARRVDGMDDIGRSSVWLWFTAKQGNA